MKSTAQTFTLSIFCAAIYAHASEIYTPQYPPYSYNYGDNGVSIFNKGALVNLIGELNTPYDANYDAEYSISKKSIEVKNSDITGATGAVPSSVMGFGVGTSGIGGATVIGGLSVGRSIYPMGGGYDFMGAWGGDIFKNTIFISKSILTGGDGADGVPPDGVMGTVGNGANGGGSIFGGVSIGGNGGFVDANVAKSDFSIKGGGGNGGNIFGNSIYVDNSKINGGDGGNGGDTPSLSGIIRLMTLGAGGYGGGSVFGGFSIGGNAGFIMNTNKKQNYKGGNGGDVFQNIINISNTTMTGGRGGDGGSITSSSVYSPIYTGKGGAGGGSIFGGVSIGGVGALGIYGPNTEGRATSDISVDGGQGGYIYENKIYLDNVILLKGQSGSGGIGTISGLSISAENGLDGGSVFGGLSYGGDGGYGGDSLYGTANGGNGGNVSRNSITISGDSRVDGDIYGGYSQGGKKGSALNWVSVDGKGGFTQNNTITLIGSNLSLNGNLYGGYSKNGDGQINPDPEYTSYYKGNTLQIQNGRIISKEIHNFQYYNWLLPKDEFDGDVIITVDAAPTYKVNINNTIHKVDVNAKGNTLHAGDKVILINKVTGNTPELAENSIEQGFFIVYDAKMDVEKYNNEDALVLTVLGTIDDNPDGKINPESESFLKGRIAQLAQVDQGADMISDSIWSARASLKKEDANIFAVTDGGSNRYEIGNTGNIKLHDFKFAVGAAKAFKLESESVGMVGIFAEHGNGNYNSYTDVGSYGKVNAHGKTRYSGVGALFHMDIAKTDISKIKNKPNIFDSKYGLYVHGALRLGHINVNYHSNDAVNGFGVGAGYNTKSRYVSTMVGAGYVLTLDEKSAVDLYSRYTFSRLNGKDVQVVDEEMSTGAAHSHRLRAGVRYGYAYSKKITPYAGFAYERNFNGDVSGSAYGFTIKEKSLKGNTGMVEVGLFVKPDGTDDSLTLNFGLQGFFDNRQGVNAAVRARYVF